MHSLSDVLAIVLSVSVLAGSMRLMLNASISRAGRELEFRAVSGDGRDFEVHADRVPVTSRRRRHSRRYTVPFFPTTDPVDVEHLNKVGKVAAAAGEELARKYDSALARELRPTVLNGMNEPAIRYSAS